MEDIKVIIIFLATVNELGQDYLKRSFFTLDFTLLLFCMQFLISSNSSLVIIPLVS